MKELRGEHQPSPEMDASPGEAEDDRELMRRVQHGDEQALGGLMERWELPVKGLIGRIVFNVREAEELAQETFVRVWQQRDKFRADAPFRPWLFAIAVNLARNRLRWWRRRPEVALDAWSGTEIGVAAVAPAAQNPTAGAAALERAERAAAVRAAIAALPLELREAIVLFEYERLSHAEIAEALNSTPKAVESRLYRAREKLRKTLASLA